MSSKDLQQEITNQLIETIEKGNNLPWRCPWVKKGFSGLPFNFSTNDPYSGINILLLWCAAAEREFSCNAWLTFKQAQALDAKVRKGEKSVRCVFYKPLEIKDENAEDGKKVIPMLKPFNLFNLDQIDGLTLPVSELDFVSEVAGNETTQFFELFANRYSESTKVDFHYSGNSAFYRPSSDSITLPPIGAFETVHGFVGTLVHEIAHSTGHPKRLDRFASNDKRFKTAKESYAFEELVAELTSAFVCAKFGLTGEHVNHANYLKHWLKALKNDKSYLFKAASAASKAFDFILNATTSKDEVINRAA